MTTRPDITVVGAGPAGLVAAATLARAGRSVRVYEKADTVGHRFSGDFQGLENWSDVDALDRLDRLGVEDSFAHKPVSDVVFYDKKFRPMPVTAPAPLFYLVRRGPEEATLDSALLDQARLAGAEVLLGLEADRAGIGDIIAIGPHYADGLATGFVFPTDLEDQAHCIISDDLAPAGYAYLLVWDGQATLATCLFDRQQQWRQARDQTVEAFSRIVGDLDLSSARVFSGYGSVLGATRYVDEAARLYVGEAAGLQDPEWGFGMWYAMESGALAARCLIEGLDYEQEARRRYDPLRDATFANRVLYERLPSAAVPWLFRRAARSRDIRSRLGRHWSPRRWKSRLADYTWPRFARNRLQHRDRACHSPTCDCVWCTHGDQHVSTQPDPNQDKQPTRRHQQ